MTYIPRSGVPGVRIDKKLSRYYVMIVRYGTSYFGGYFPLSEIGWNAARSSALTLIAQHPPLPRPRSKSGKPRNASVRIHRSAAPKSVYSATGVRNVYLETHHNRYRVQITHKGIKHEGGYFPATPDGLSAATARATELRSELQRTSVNNSNEHPP